MDDPTLFPLEQSASVYAALREVQWLVEGVEIPEWLTSCRSHFLEDDLLAEESYARVLLAIRLVRRLREGVDCLDWIASPAEKFASGALDQLFELETMLAAQVMSYKAEALKLESDQAEIEALAS